MVLGPGARKTIRLSSRTQRIPFNVLSRTTKIELKKISISNKKASWFIQTPEKVLTTKLEKKRNKTFFVMLIFDYLDFYVLQFNNCVCILYMFL